MTKFLRQFNWISFVSMLALVALGTRVIWSAGNTRAEVAFHSLWVGNLTMAVFGLGLYFAIAFFDYRRILEYLSVPVFLFSLLLLVLVLLFGREVMGARRWILSFQPSEFAKLCTLAALAALAGHPRLREAGLWRSYRGFLLAGALIAVPAGLILLEPDLGTTIPLLVAGLVMMLVAGIWRKVLVTLVAVGAVAVAVILGAVYEAEKPGVTPERRAAILHKVPLRDHQISRVKVFLFPESDQLGKGYNLRQAKIAIGSGGYAGKGVGNSETSRLKYLPSVVAINDFIFCVYAEETGYCGSLLLLALYLTLLVSACWTAARTDDLRGRLLVLGFVTMVFVHVFVNIGMSIGMMPITGLPLPFVSAGRTFLLVLLMGFGLVQSVALHRGTPE